jgi:SpoVK/Ycf46/Vps4 family AAA+-type ATPase
MSKENIKVEHMTTKELIESLDADGPIFEVGFPILEEEDGPMSKEKANKLGYNQWSFTQDGRFIPALPTVKKVPAGFYKVKYDSSIGGYHLVIKEVTTDELYELPSKELEDVIDDIKKFWANWDKYRDYNFLHKRGILLYGEPGCGKSGIIQLCTNHLIKELNGIVISIADSNDIENYISIVQKLRAVEPDRPLIIIMEDIDAISGDNSWAASQLLNMLDGLDQIEHVVYIATTNYPEKLAERITNRPSRFDRRYEVDMPSPEVRTAYITAKLTEEDLKGIDIVEWVEKTKGMSLAHLKELIVSVLALGNHFDDTIERLNALKQKPKIKSKDTNIGFGK